MIVTNRGLNSIFGDWAIQWCHCWPSKTLVAVLLAELWGKLHPSSEESAPTFCHLFPGSTASFASQFSRALTSFDNERSRVPPVSSRCIIINTMKPALFFIVAIVCLEMGNTLKCYKCNDPPSKACGFRSFDKNGLGVKIDECEPEAKCIRTVTFQPEDGKANETSRGCFVHETDLHGYSQTQGVQSEVLYCETDLCNGADSIAETLISFLVIITILVIASHD
ncbi:uncharacterized protein [Venturia canescens]|uniref:uncharacterized protein n=1 Tax=Venturia canescens TaxID=32260 RepID=UPI001C9C5B12|nr:uncharacterized protein LOC122415420 [Venturia canescens]